MRETFFWSELSTLDFSGLDLANGVAVLPLGATEQHGPHLSLGVDSDLVNGVVAASLAHLPKGSPVWFLPTQPVGLSPEHAAFAGTLTLKPETVLRLWTDLGESVAAAGIRKLLLFNAHGGHVGMMDVVARDLRARVGMAVFSASWYSLPLLTDSGGDAQASFSAHEHRFGIHAGAVETSMMLALRPELVNMALAQNFASRSEARARNCLVLGNGRSVKFAWQAQDYNPWGAMGDATVATAEQGEALVQAAGRALAKTLLEMVDLPTDVVTSTTAYRK